MKKLLLLLTMGFTVVYGFSQTTEAFDYISPFHQDFAAVKKGDQWGFINKKGDLIIPFRSDLVVTKTSRGTYPFFSSERCLIKREKNNISYFGYIDTSGKTVIKPEFLNATNFSEGLAIALKVNKEKAGYNDVLGKDIVYYTYVEIVMNTLGKVKGQTSKAVNVVLDKRFLPKPPKIISKLISESLVALKNEKNNWIIKRL